MNGSANAYFINPTSTNGPGVLGRVVLYDSAPVQCYLASGTSDEKSYVPGLVDNTDYTAATAASKVPDSELHFRPYRYARPLRIISLMDTGRGEIGVTTEAFYDVASVEDRLSGVVFPDAIHQIPDNQRCVISSLTFCDPCVAGEFVYQSCIGFHICVYTMANSTILQVPRFSGQWAPFYRTSKYKRLQPDEVPTVGLYGPGWLPAVAYIPTPATLTWPVAPVQNAPFVCTPIQGNYDLEAKNFIALCRILVSVDATTTVTFPENATNVSTNIPCYRVPFLRT